MKDDPEYLTMSLSASCGREMFTGSSKNVSSPKLT